MSSASPNTSFGRTYLIALAAVLVTVDSAWQNLFGRLDNRLCDFFVRQAAQQLSPDPDIVIVDIGEVSLDAKVAEN
jgi:CHASE2 domain-containing sensor protein